MHPSLVDAVLALSRELRECLASGEHPGAAACVAREAYGTASRLHIHGCCDLDTRNLLSDVLGALVDAARRFAVDPGRVVTVDLPRELGRLRGLVELAERCREEEAAVC